MTITMAHLYPQNGHTARSHANAMTCGKRPRFEDLPLQPGHPKGSAWGLWGDDDECGTLNLLTEDVVRAASSEVVLGKVVSLK